MCRTYVQKWKKQSLHHSLGNDSSASRSHPSSDSFLCSISKILVEDWFSSWSISCKSCQECHCKARSVSHQGSLGREGNRTSSLQKLLAGSSCTSSASLSQFGLFFCVFQITSAITAQVWTTGELSVWPNQGASASRGIPSTHTHTPSPPSASQSWTEGTPTAATQGIRRKLRGASPWMKTISLTCATSQHVVNTVIAFKGFSHFKRSALHAPSLRRIV